MNAIEKLQAERQRLVDRLAQIDKILGQYEELQRVAESYLTGNTPHTKLTDSDTVQIGVRDFDEVEARDRMQTTTSSRRPKTPMTEFEAVVVEVLSDAEKPLDRSALYKALGNRGVVIGSADESSDLNTLSARMSRMKEKVVNVSGYGYWLKERAFHEGGYAPRDQHDAQRIDDSIGNGFD